MKRVAIFASCDSFEGFYGGTFGLSREQFLSSYRNDFIWEYAEGLRRCGHHVVIYILSYDRPEMRETGEGLCVRFIPLPRWLRVADALLFRARKISYAPQIRDRVAYLGYNRALQRALRDDSIDVLYNQEIWTPRFDILLQQSAIPVIGADHGAVYSPWMAAGKRRWLRRAAKLVCQSLTGLERARELGGDAVLMYNGVDTKFFSPSESALPRSRTILAVGRFVEEQKRFADLLQAMCDLPDFTLTLVGSGPDEGKLKKLAVDLGVMDRVHFTGFVTSRTELRRLYQECGVFVSTSSWEAVALVLLEAMSCGAPVVATEIPSFKELLTDGKDGLLVPVGKPEAVAHGVRTAFERQHDLGLNARKTVEAEYSSKILYSRLSALIEAIQDQPLSVAETLQMVQH